MPHINLLAVLYCFDICFTLSGDCVGCLQSLPLYIIHWRWPLPVVVVAPQDKLGRPEVFQGKSRQVYIVDIVCVAQLASLLLC